MGIRLIRFPQCGVVLHVYSGALTADETAKHFQNMGASDVSPAIHAFAADVDLSGFDVVHIPFVKRAIALQEGGLPSDSPRLPVVICRSKAVREFFDFWNNYCDAGDLNVAPSRIVSSMKEACDWLRLPGDACEALTAAEAVPEPLSTPPPESTTAPE